MVENTLAAFRSALAIGVTTLECDVNISADGVPMVTHDRVVLARKCRDTAPVTPGDTAFPYVGRFVSRLSAAQLRTLDCGSLTQPRFPSQRAVPGERMPLFDEVIALARATPHVRVNVEAKFDVVHPDETAPRQTFVDTTVEAIRRSGMLGRASVQSFDWQVLRMVRRAEPRIACFALADEESLEIGRPGRSLWLGGLDIDDLHGDLVAAVADLGFDALSPSYKRLVTRDLVDRSHDAGLRVVPYTVDDPLNMASFVDLGVDGFITNYPDRARDVLAARGVPLP